MHNNEMPEILWVVSGADDPALEFTAMSTKEYETCVEYLKKSTITAQLKAGDEVVAALKSAIDLVEKVVTGKVAKDDFNTGVLASYRDEFEQALASYASVRKGK